MTLGDRTAAMADRLARVAREAGLGDRSAADLAATFIAVTRARPEVADPHHYAWLHPARNALILLDDIKVRDPVELRAAIWFDSMRPARVDSADAAAAELVATVPRAGMAADRLLEELVTAQDASRRIALADRLDHARHLHLEPEETWTAFHSDTRDVWLPVAERTHNVFARRLRWWTGMFERRWLPRVRP